MKSTMKKLLALVCVLALGVGGIAVHAPTEEVKAAEETTDITPVYLEGFQHVTLSSFNTASSTQFTDSIELDGIKDATGAYGSEVLTGYLTNMQTGNTGTTLQTDTTISFDKHLLSLWVDFGAASTVSNRLEVAAPNADSTNGSGEDGIWFMPYNDTTFQLRIMENGTPIGSKNIALSTTGLTTVTERFLLQISFEYSALKTVTDAETNTEANTRDVTIKFYFNGQTDNVVTYSKTDVPDAVLGRRLEFYTDASNDNVKRGIKVESCVPENKNWEKLTWSDFLDGSKNEAKNQAYMKGEDMTYALNSTKYANSLYSKLSNTSFEANVRFTGSGDDEKLHYGTTANWSGLAFLVDANGRLYLRTVPSASLPFIAPGNAKKNVVYFYPEIANVGSSFVDTEFTLKITNQCADYDGDNSADDVELGIFFNGKLYNNQYLYILDYQNYSYAGNKIGILTKSAEIMIRSTPQVDEVLHQLSTLTDAKYTTLTTDLVGAASVYTGNTLVENLDAMAIPGDYMVKDAEGTDIGQVILYEENDTHPDGSIDAVDLVAMLKVQQGTALSTWSGTMGAYAADFSETNIINEILGIETVSE